MYIYPMPGKPHSRRRLRRAAHVLGVGTTLAVAGSSSSSWAQASIKQQWPAFLSSPCRGNRGFGGKCRPRSDRHGGLGLPSAASAAAPRVMAMNSRRRSAPCGAFGTDGIHQKGPQAAIGAAAGASRAATRTALSVGPIKAMSVLLHDEPVRSLPCSRWAGARRETATNTVHREICRVRQERLNLHGQSMF